MVSTLYRIERRGCRPVLYGTKTSLKVKITHRAVFARARHACSVQPPPALRRQDRRRLAQAAFPCVRPSGCRALYAPLRGSGGTPSRASPPRVGIASWWSGRSRAPGAGRRAAARGC
eukprot:scaffold132840_cov48-Phaeocystis_antarctica.AAC.2